ncbi:MAG TPA: DinB family protein [Roseiflexaceae bacterium]|nr:DinB family protein [Roseiflexaceae bacterium]
MSESVKAQIDILAAFPEQLKRQIKGLDEAALRFRPAPDEWSIMEIIGHIIDVGALWPGRTRQMLAADNPALAVLDSNWVRQRDYHNKQADFLLITLAEQRAEYVEFLRTLRPAQLARTGIHPTRGPLTVELGIAALADHDHEHSRQIAANLEVYDRQAPRSIA